MFQIKHQKIHNATLIENARTRRNSRTSQPYRGMKRNELFAPRLRIVEIRDSQPDDERSDGTVTKSTPHYVPPFTRWIQRSMPVAEMIMGRRATSKRRRCDQRRAWTDNGSTSTTTTTVYYGN
jgi:hypothetical protein